MQISLVSYHFIFSVAFAEIVGTKDKVSLSPIKIEIANIKNNVRFILVKVIIVNNHMRWPTKKKDKNNDDEITMNFVQGV